jgi:hypothetical protein
LLDSAIDKPWVKDDIEAVVGLVLNIAKSGLEGVGLCPQVGVFLSTTRPTDVEGLLKFLGLFQLGREVD